jgi:hypothetical protein
MVGKTGTMHMIGMQLAVARKILFRYVAVRPLPSLCAIYMYAGRACVRACGHAFPPPQPTRQYAFDT